MKTRRKSSGEAIPFIYSSSGRSDEGAVLPMWGVSEAWEPAALPAVEHEAQVAYELAGPARGFAVVV